MTKMARRSAPSVHHRSVHHRGKRREGGGRAGGPIKRACATSAARNNKMSDSAADYSDKFECESLGKKLLQLLSLQNSRGTYEMTKALCSLLGLNLDTTRKCEYEYFKCVFFSVTC